MSDTQYEVVLSITITAKVEDKVAYLVEIQQAGVFLLNGFPEQQVPPMLGAYCPNLLFPMPVRPSTMWSTRAASRP